MDESIVVRVGRLLVEHDMKLVVAESCTGGLIGHLITNVQGSSQYYLGGIVAYSYEAKRQLLGVSAQTLNDHGAVSRETVLEMANGVRQIFSGENPPEKIIAVSVSGIAGPDGAQPGKPVGLVWIGISSAKGDWAFAYHGTGDRIQNKLYSAQCALELVTRCLEGELPILD
ncbi:MAG: CinA family protein [Chloroflexota bacterium]